MADPTPAGQPIYILKEGTQRSRGRSAQASNIRAAVEIANVVRSTLGPRGMDKMLVDASGDVVITNDGATILKEMEVGHPAAKMLIEVAKAQDTECGDGTKTSVILTGELLKLAGQLLDDGLHAATIQTGYHCAAQEALRVLEGLALPIGKNETNLLRHISKTSLYSKNIGSDSDLISDIVVKACTAVAETKGNGTDVDLDNILVQKATGLGLEDTGLIEGILLDKVRAHTSMPQRVRNARIALVDAALEIKKTEVSEEIRIAEPGQLEAFVAQEEQAFRAMVDKVVGSGANVLVSQKGIGDSAQQFLAKAGVYAVQRVKKSDLEKLAKATGARPVSTLDDLTAKNLGAAALVEDRRIEENHFTFITGCASPKAVSILIRGGTQHVVDEAERAIHDALSVVSVAIKDGKMTPGGGASAVDIAMRVRDFAGTVGGREQLAIEAFANAFEVIPRALAENAGLDELDLLLNLRKAHRDGKKNAGINVFNGKIEDMLANHVIEPLRLSTQEVKAATETANMILRIDDVIAAKAFTAPAGGGP
jgi:archaeal chaperonin